MKGVLFLLLATLSVYDCHCSCITCNDYRFHFETRSVTDYAIIEGMPSLDALTVSFWMRSDFDSGKIDYCIPFSYAAKEKFGNDIDIVLWKNKAKLIIVGKETSEFTIITDDNQWHHICFTWEKTAGQWKVYKDGADVASGSGLATGYVIPSGGLLVLAQDQDVPGGGFDAKNAFVGDLGGVNVWSRVLSAQEISGLSDACYAGQGNVFMWSDFKGKTRGDVEVLEPCDEASLGPK